jgi:hypothetical protein
MNAAVSRGTTHIGETEHISWSAQNEYMGSTQTADTVTKHYQRRWKKFSEKFDHFEDHRACSSCGCTWDVARRVKKSGLRRSG